MNNNIKLLKNYVLYFLFLILISIVGISNIFGATISDYAVKYYWYVSNDNSSTTSTDYRTGSDNKVTLYGATAPTYDNGEGFNGFYIRVNNSLTKGSIYTLSFTVSYNSLQSSEFSSYYVNNRLLNTDFAHCSSCTITSVSGFIRTYNSTNQAISGLYDYVVHMSYTFVATADVNQFYIGSYTGDDRTMGLDNHSYTSTIIVANLDLSNDNNSTIINQNDTIIEQNNQIIEQNEQNTQDIIDNQNQNAQDIINNQNSNTQQQIQSQQVCNDYDKNFIDSSFNSGFLNSSGNYYSNNSYGVSNYLNVYNSEVKVLSSGVGETHACFYDVNKTKISCVRQSTWVVNDILVLPTSTYYIRISIRKSDSKPTIRVCKNGNQSLDDSINSLNDNLNDDDSSGATSEASDFFSNFTTNTFGLTSIITAPLNLIQSITSSICTDLHLPLPYLNNKYLDLPCMTTIYSTYFGSFFTIYQTITFGIIAYWVCVRVFNLVKDFKNPEHDEIEVLDL